MSMIPVGSGASGRAEQQEINSLENQLRQMYPKKAPAKKPKPPRVPVPKNHVPGAVTPGGATVHWHTDGKPPTKVQAKTPTNLPNQPVK